MSTFGQGPKLVKIACSRAFEGERQDSDEGWGFGVSSPQRRRGTEGECGESAQAGRRGKDGRRTRKRKALQEISGVRPQPKRSWSKAADKCLQGDKALVMCGKEGKKQQKKRKS